MKNIMLILVVLLLNGCSFLYDSRGENQLTVGKGEYQLIKAEDAKIKTGRYISIRVFK